jgi:hypothetical protein
MEYIKYFATLALGSQPRQGFVKVWAKYEARESHFMLLGMQESVREWTLTFPSELPLWDWSLGGLPNLQKAIVAVKTHWIEKFLISWESSWNIDV